VSAPLAAPLAALAVVPFLIYLLVIAAMPLLLARFWDDNRNKLAVALVAALPVAIYVFASSPDGAGALADTARDYAAFMALIGALFVITAGIYLRGELADTPAVNTGLLAVGAVLASAIGTTGASALLIRPLLRANAQRRRTRHIVVFFIFVVANGGGLLTPLGDPPLFLGFLRGVPFSWTLHLAPAWGLVSALLLAIFALVDRAYFRREPPRPPRPPRAGREPLRIEGSWNLVWLAGVIATVFAVGEHGRRSSAAPLVQIAAMIGFAALSLATTPRRIREANRFSWAPILEVAAVFLGIFITMVPALAFLEARGASLGIARPWQFFWASGALSSVLDNAPTYLTFASLATGVVNAGGAQLPVHDLGALAAHPAGRPLLAAVSCGSVFMGAMTYIGNGPNFMVKAIAEQHHVRMPSFFGYLAWSFAILLPVLAAAALVMF
jgi:Na+/H+ antiporter NhaD/arsenite permease-like protein